MSYFYKLLKSNPRLWRFLKIILLYLRFLKSSKPFFGIITIKKIEPSIIIANKGYHCFFGYYDKTPWNNSMNKLLFNSINKKDKRNLNINVFDIKSQKSYIIDQTLAWNWQQGAMLQWLSDEDVIFNIYTSSDKLYKAKKMNIITQDSKIYPLPLYSRGKVTSKYLSLNFERLHIYARGYGYCAKNPSIKDDKDDGLWEVDMSTNKIKLIITINDIKNKNPKPEFNECLHYINHVEYFDSDSKCIFIHRWFKKNARFKSRLIMYDIKLQELKVLLDNNHVSHYCWKDETTLFIFATNGNNEEGYFEINIKNGETTNICKDMPTFDGHPSFSPDKSYILTDGYPDHKRLQPLFLYNTKSKKTKTINKFYSPFKYFDEKRCDLHPRWSPDGKYVSVDTTYTGDRSMAIFKII